MTKLTKEMRKFFANRTIAQLRGDWDAMLVNPVYRVKATGHVKLKAARHADAILAEIMQRRREAAAPFIGELCRDGVTVFYVNGANGPEECDDFDYAVYRLIDMGRIE